MENSPTKYLNRQNRRIYKSKTGKFYILKDGKKQYKPKALYQNTNTGKTIVNIASVPAEIRPKQIPKKTNQTTCSGPDADKAMKLLEAHRKSGATLNNSVKKLETKNNKQNSPKTIGSNMLIRNLVRND